MNYRLSGAICALLFASVLFSCKKESQVAQFQAVTFKFGADTTSISIDNAVQVLKNMPRSCDVTQLSAAAVLPAGYSISPDPAVAKDYTKGVTYTINTNQGKSYSVQITAPVYDAVNNPYGIYTPKQLSDIRNGLNDSYVLMNDIQLPDMTASNANAITGISDYKYNGWYSIGATYVNGGKVAFRGTLDGQNHIIKNFATINRPDGVPPPDGFVPGKNGKNGDGIFGLAVRATFKNIGIQLSPEGIVDLDDRENGTGQVGSLLGAADSTTVTNCYVTGNASISGKTYTGGLLGYISNSTISKCYAALTPSAGSVAIKSASDAGGLIGGALNSDISDSYSSCSVQSRASIGGLIGYVNTSAVKTCYASGSVKETPENTVGSLVASNSLGGLIGSVNSISPATSSIQNCYATGAVAGANGTNTNFHKGSRIGGLIGQISPAAGPVSVTYCYAMGAVSRVSTSDTAPYLIGGLVGNTPNNVFVFSGVCTNYWDKTTTGRANLGGGDGSLAQDNSITANGKTTEEMKTKATFLNWDFSAVWNVVAGTNNGYPNLRSLNK
ncbi:hypothetical protein OCK74_02130 [Chitinophagaceae bacterium LB-8]|uniref:GLUG domain-containing protein n=1 Tax=Paraflavisolibacter caeni TaxID=2982496 RepID=A0A9X2XNC9_9BACT|nr:hypothetical protein [Paraflavisolibacter caeni]MCU7547889.1 hypothetical protein [Paraflavisolibacter caeni]